MRTTTILALLTLALALGMLGANIGADMALRAGEPTFGLTLMLGLAGAAAPLMVVATLCFEMWETRSTSRIPVRGSHTRAGRDLAREARERSASLAARARTTACPREAARLWGAAIEAKRSACEIASKRAEWAARDQGTAARNARGLALTRASSRPRS